MNTEQADNHRILVIDDNPAIHEDFRKILVGREETADDLKDAEIMLFGSSKSAPPRARFEIDSAYQGEEGLHMVESALAEGRPYALAFVDVRMPPGWDGVETINRIWKQYPELQVVICTAYSDYSWAEINHNLSPDDNLLILKKPFDNVEVLQFAHSLTRKWLLARQANQVVDNLEQMVRQRTADLERANERLRMEIAERVQTEEALRISEERFSKAFHASPIPMVIQSAVDQRFADVNNSFLAMIGYGREQVLKLTPTDLSLCSDLEQWKRLRESSTESAPIRNLESEVRTKSGELRSVLISAVSIRLGKEPYLLIITQDITEQLELEEQLRQAHKMEAVGQLAAGIAHDFNNIITIIQGHAQLRLASASLDEKVEHSLQQVSNAAARAAALTRQLLAFSRKQILQPTALDLSGHVQHLTDMLRRLIGEHIHLETDCAEGLPSVHADPCSVEQIIMNLAVNARDAMPEGGSLVLRTRSVTVNSEDHRFHPEALPGAWVCLSVIDSGCGMDEATKKRVFEPFFTTKEVGKGTGMGLATVYGIVKQHSGWIEVESRLDHGSAFNVFFPISGEAVKPQIEPAVAPKGARANQTILLVEDERDLRQLATGVLRHYGYNVLSAASAAEALDHWRHHSRAVDLLFTDIVMPGGVSGRELAERLLEERPELKVIYTSGYSVELFGAGLRLKEGVNYLPKPYVPAALANALARALEAV